MARGKYAPEEYRQRPRDYDPLKADDILERISNGETLHDICHDDRDMPMPGTFLRWCDEEPELEKRHAVARSRGADVNIDAGLSAAFNNDPTKARVQSDALFRHAEKMAPDKYSPRANLKPVGEKDQGGYDAGAELRRKVEAMAARAAASQQPADSGQNQG